MMPDGDGRRSSYQQSVFHEALLKLSTKLTSHNRFGLSLRVKALQHGNHSLECKLLQASLWRVSLLRILETSFRNSCGLIAGLADERAPVQCQLCQSLDCKV